MKKFIKKILRLLGWKLIKIKIKKPTSYAFGKPEIQDFEYINKASGVICFFMVVANSILLMLLTQFHVCFRMNYIFSMES